MADRTAVAHVAHDELLISAWVSGDTDPDEAARAADLASRCDECRDLATDLRGLRAAVRALPSPPRPRDFRLTPADAERLRSRPGWLRRFRAVRGATITRPLAGAMTTLGLAGLLLTTVPLGGAGVGGEDRDTARIEAVGAPSGGDAGAAGGAAPSAAASVAAAPASAEAAVASDGLQPAAASRRPDFIVSPMPGDATSTDGGGDDRELSGTPPAAGQVSPPTSSPAADIALRSVGNPTGPIGTDLTRPALAVASSALLAGGLLLLFVTRRRGARHP